MGQTKEISEIEPEMKPDPVVECCLVKLRVWDSYIVLGTTLPLSLKLYMICGGLE